MQANKATKYANEGMWALHCEMSRCQLSPHVVVELDDEYLDLDYSQ